MGQLHEVEKREKDLLNSCNSKGELIQFILEKEFEVEYYNEPGEPRKQRLENLMNKIFELHPEIDFKTPLSNKK